MPELPEVETVVRTLQPQLIGLRIVHVRATRKRLRHPLSHRHLARLLGQSFTAVCRRGKWIVLELQQHCLLVHLGMTGRLRLVSANTPAAPHEHAVFTCTPGRSELRYSDPRRFGTLLVFPHAQARDYLENQLGPEPFALTAAEFEQRLRATRRAIKVALMDQRLLAGVGNIYSDEALHVARIHPARPACSLSSAECQRLLSALQQVLIRAIECHGSTIRDYIFGENGRGTYQDEFLVYGRARQPCRQCSQLIQRLRLAQRSSYYCPECQPQT
jgi:formamidopyrimidine-DNA glycosylase